MQISIEVPDNLPQEAVLRKVKAVEEALRKEAACLDKEDSFQQTAREDDPWTCTDIEVFAIDTGREDGSVNHDQYLYGATKSQ